MTNSKTCVRCQQASDLTNYYVNKKTGKLINTCKTCFHKANAEYRAKNASYDLQRQRAYYKANQVKLLSAKKVDYYENIEFYRAQARKRTPEQRAAVNKRYFAAHPEVAKKFRTLRKAKMRNAGIFTISNTEIKKLMSSACNSCKTTNNIQLDHIMPIARGGRHSIGNLMPLCQKCNLQKGTKTWFEYKLWKAKIAR